jgi:hypothetical protein
MHLFNVVEKYAAATAMTVAMRQRRHGYLCNNVALISRL